MAPSLKQRAGASAPCESLPERSGCGGHTCRSARPYHQAAGVYRCFGVRGFVHVAPTHARRLSRFGGREFASQDTSSLSGQAPLRPFRRRADLTTSSGPAGTTFPPVQSVRSVCSGFGGASVSLFTLAAAAHSCARPPIVPLRLSAAPCVSFGFLLRRAALPIGSTIEGRRAHHA